MSEHFCATCNRLRITADGNLKVFYGWKNWEILKHFRCAFTAPRKCRCGTSYGMGRPMPNWRRSSPRLFSARRPNTRVILTQLAIQKIDNLSMGLTCIFRKIHSLSVTSGPNSVNFLSDPRSLICSSRWRKKQNQMLLGAIYFYRKYFLGLFPFFQRIKKSKMKTLIKHRWMIFLWNFNFSNFWTNFFQSKLNYFNCSGMENLSKLTNRPMILIGG